jgi:hypothetical protein
MTKAVTTATKGNQIFSTLGYGKTHAVITAVRVAKVRSEAEHDLTAIERLELRLQGEIYQTGDWDFSEHYASARAVIKRGQELLTAIEGMADTDLFWSVASWHGSFENAERKARQIGLGRSPFVEIIEAN